MNLDMQDLLFLFLKELQKTALKREEQLKDGDFW